MMKKALLFCLAFLVLLIASPTLLPASHAGATCTACGSELPTAYSWNDTNHYIACSCGATYNAAPHSLSGSPCGDRHCSCGYTAHGTGHVPGAAATCNSPQTCTACGETLAPAVGHAWSAWQYTGNGYTHTHTRTCTNGCGATETNYCSSSGYPTCIQDEICTVCRQVLWERWGHYFCPCWSANEAGHWHPCINYGCGDYTGYAEHTTITVEAIAPTCTRGGYTQGRYCTTCQYVFEYQASIPPTGHQYGEWASIGNGKHAITCSRCNSRTSAACAYVSVNPGDQSVSVCPICGDMQAPEGQPAPLAAKILRGVKAQDDSGTASYPTVLAGELPDGTRYLTVAFSSGGKATPRENAILIRIPASALAACAHLYAEMADGEETELEMTADDEWITFTLPQEVIQDGYCSVRIAEE